jgi:hypothetical protein
MVESPGQAARVPADLHGSVVDAVALRCRAGTDDLRRRRSVVVSEFGDLRPDCPRGPGKYDLDAAVSLRFRRSDSDPRLSTALARYLRDCAAASRISRTASGTPPSQAGLCPGSTQVVSTPSIRSSDATA